MDSLLVMSHTILDVLDREYMKFANLVMAKTRLWRL
jgi:hypothetical protein